MVDPDVVVAGEFRVLSEGENPQSLQHNELLPDSRSCDRPTSVEEGLCLGSRHTASLPGDAGQSYTLTSDKS